MKKKYLMLVLLFMAGAAKASDFLYSFGFGCAKVALSAATGFSVGYCTERFFNSRCSTTRSIVSGLGLSVIGGLSYAKNFLSGYSTASFGVGAFFGARSARKITKIFREADREADRLRSAMTRRGLQRLSSPVARWVETEEQARVRIQRELVEEEKTTLDRVLAQSRQEVPDEVLAGDGYQEDILKCRICLEPLLEDCENLKCCTYSFFHHGCLEKALARVRRSPCCRKVVSDEGYRKAGIPLPALEEEDLELL